MSATKWQGTWGIGHSVIFMSVTLPAADVSLSGCPETRKAQRTNQKYHSLGR